MLYGHGDNSYLFDTKIVADFSSNVYFKNPSDGLIEHLKNKLGNIKNYPEVASESLCNKIAQYLGLKTENILITNGATEAFYLIAQNFSGSTSDIFVPSFAEYQDACKLFNHKIKLINNKQLNEECKSFAQLTWLCNPNNPDGKIIEKNKLEQLVKANPKTLFILDEAYTDFSLENLSLVDKITELNNLLIVRSMTKKYAIPGLRLGYIVASKNTIEQLTKIKQPWSVNCLAIEAGKFLVDNNNPDFNIAELIESSLDFQKQLSKIEGIKVKASKTSFFLLQLQKPAAQTVKYLANEHGFLVRNAANFHGLDDSYIRISTRNSKDNQKLVKALTQWMKL